MKKIVLSTLSLATLLGANQSFEQTQTLITQKKEAVKKLELDIAKLEKSIAPDIDEVKRREANKLVTHTEFGYSQTSGNTDTTSYNLDSKIKKAWDKHIFNLIFDGQYQEDSNIESKNKYLAELSYDYKIAPKFAFNYLTGYKDDKFSGFDYQFYTGPGANYRVLERKAHTIDVDGNILFSQDKTADTHYDAGGAIIAYPNPTNIAVASIVSGDTKNYSSLRVKGKYEWKILKNLKFNQEMTYRAKTSNIDNYFIFSKTALASKINGTFSFGMSYKVDYVNLPVGGNKSTDTTLSANIIMDY